MPVEHRRELEHHARRDEHEFVLERKHVGRAVGDAKDLMSVGIAARRIDENKRAGGA